MCVNKAESGCLLKSTYCLLLFTSLVLLIILTSAHLLRIFLRLDDGTTRVTLPSLDSAGAGAGAGRHTGVREGPCRETDV